jgi:ADP-ribosyl-[dinitrogen reductase] hydrolase
MIDFESRLKGGIFGACIGDALGVPVEFKSRQYLKQNPVHEMIGYGTYSQLPGTWSDDSSMTFCTIDSLCKGYNLKDIANNFIKWRYESFWTPYGIVFDIGIGTNKAIIKLTTAKNPEKAGNNDERSNGNGSLMRIMPMAYYFNANKTENRFEIINAVSSTTHAHIRSVLSCYIYVEYAMQLLNGIDKNEAYIQTMASLKLYFQKTDIPPYELMQIDRVLNGQIAILTENQLSSSGYVIDSLESSFWSFLNSSSYTEAVLKSVNLGGDTDTTAAITGGLAGLYYGYEALPADWIKKLARLKDITNLVAKFYKSLLK